MTQARATIDMRSDTVTRPTEAMYAAMLAAPLEDDGYGDDPDVGELERLAARLTGKAAAVFVPSGTMANLIAVLTSARPGGRVLAEASSHVVISELEGASVLARQRIVPIDGIAGRVDVGILRTLLEDGSQPSLVCLENTHTASGGRVLDLAFLDELRRAVAGRAPIHLDGARLFNAAVYLQCEVRDLCSVADSVSVALSKGLSAPAGSVLCGTEDMIARARRFRKMLGGGMRQTGILASAGKVALGTMIGRLSADHARAKALAAGLSAVAPGSVSSDQVETNIILCDPAAFRLPVVEIARRLGEQGILARITNDGSLRFVLHHHITDENVAAVIAAVAEVTGASLSPPERSNA